MKTCTKCNESKSFDNYYKNSRRPDGYNSQYKQCADEATKISRSKKAEHYRLTRKRNRDNCRQKFSEWKSEKGCLVCSENEPCCLDLHHLDPSEKEADPSSLAAGSWDKLMEEVSKCVVVCKNCHCKIHAGIIDLEKLM